MCAPDRPVMSDPATYKHHVSATDPPLYTYNPSTTFDHHASMTPVIAIGPDNRQWIDLQSVSPKLLQELRGQVFAGPQSDSQGPLTKGAAKVKAWIRQRKQGIDIRLRRKTGPDRDEVEDFSLVLDSIPGWDKKSGPLPELSECDRVVHELSPSCPTSELPDDEPAYGDKTWTMSMAAAGKCTTHELPADGPQIYEIGSEQGSNLSSTQSSPTSYQQPVSVLGLSSASPVSASAALSESARTSSVSGAAEQETSTSSAKKFIEGSIGFQHEMQSLKEDLDGTKRDLEAQRQTAHHFELLLNALREPSSVAKGTTQEEDKDSGYGSAHPILQGLRLVQAKKYETETDVEPPSPSGSRNQRQMRIVNRNMIRPRRRRLPIKSTTPAAKDYLSSNASEADWSGQHPLTQKQLRHLSKSTPSTAGPEALWTAVLRSQAKLLGEEHPLTHKAKYSLSLSRSSHHRNVSGCVFEGLRESKALAAQQLGEIHPLVTTFSEDLATLEQLTGQGGLDEHGVAHENGSPLIPIFIKLENNTSSRPGAVITPTKSMQDEIMETVIKDGSPIASHQRSLSAGNSPLRVSPLPGLDASEKHDTASSTGSSPIEDKQSLRERHVSRAPTSPPSPGGRDEPLALLKIHEPGSVEEVKNGHDEGVSPNDNNRIEGNEKKLADSHQSAFASQSLVDNDSTLQRDLQQFSTRPERPIVTTQFRQASNERSPFSVLPDQYHGDGSPDVFRSNHSPRSDASIMSSLIVAGLTNLFVRSMLWIQRNYGLEPPEEQGKIRVRWTCRCGEKLWDDYEEKVPGAARRWETCLRTHAGTRSHPADAHGNQAFGSALGQHQSFQAPVGPNGYNGRGTLNEKTAQRLMSASTNTFYQPYSSWQQPEPPWLLVCANEDKLTPTLEHVNVSQHRIPSDKELGCALRKHYSEVSRKRWRPIKLRGLTAVKFVQLEVHLDKFADIRKCPDMPSLNQEYDFMPAADELVPPLGSSFLLHFLSHPDMFEKELTVYSRLPKKVNGQLRYGIGWGIHMVEGFRADLIWLLIGGLFALASLVFGTVWAAMDHDVQGAFGVAAWVCALAVLVTGWLQAWFG